MRRGDIEGRGEQGDNDADGDGGAAIASRSGDGLGLDGQAHSRPPLPLDSNTSVTRSIQHKDARVESTALLQCRT